MAEVVTHVAGRAHRAPRSDARPLSPREGEILGLVARGVQQKAIARQLRISTQTVKNHMTHVFEALDADNAPHAVHLAHLRGLFGAGGAWHLGDW